MEEVKVLKSENILFDKCKCCLGDGELKDMWSEYHSDGRIEIYGQMLSECFELTLENCSETGGHIEQICDSCICRLREALDFKREVLACEQLRYEHLNNGFHIEVKCEVEDYEEGPDHEYTGDMDTGVKLEGDNRDSYRIDGLSEQGSDMFDCTDEVQEFEDVQYLEIDDEADDKIYAIKPSAKNPRTSGGTQKGHQPSEPSKREDHTAARDSDAPRGEGPRRKWPRKRKKHERLKIYKQYTRGDMTKALEAVRSGELSKLDAAIKFKVPRKTLSSKLIMANKETDSGDEKREQMQVYYKFVDEVKTILTYTNAVPFKTKAARYFCAYCSTDGPHFEEPDELRVHTRTRHVDDRTRDIEMMLRPKHQNEVLKVDIDALHCAVCCTILPTWTGMFRHLEEAHAVQLDEAYTKVIPYVLKRELQCALCNEGFSNFHHLDGHMNAHYSSYICQECGDTFLSASRLGKHVKVHATGRHPCAACGKVFTLDKYRRKHYDHVHKQQHNIKCLYCTEKFYGTFQRHLHVVDEHKEKVKVITCELCGLRFEWKPYYIAHLRRKHNIVNK